MGLLLPSQGKILVDGQDLHDPEHPERLAAWRASIALVLKAFILLIARLLKILPLVCLEMKLILKGSGLLHNGLRSQLLLRVVPRVIQLCRGARCTTKRRAASTY